MSPRTRQLARGLALIAGLLAAWQALDHARRRYIKAFFIDGAVADSAPPWPLPAAPGLTRVDRVRVVLLDGLSLAHADRLPQLSALCARGQRLTLDVGFPTVSLPVQHVLWTGLTQQQSGVQYHIGELATPAHAIPAQVDSVAVAESHPEIVRSFGFTAAAPPPTDAPDPAWPDSFPAAARAAIEGPARLAFVHVLRIDDAGHKTGGASPEYAAAATWSDDLLATLWSAAPADPHTRWFLLADHGHRPAGGHGDAEPGLRRVRACVVGGDPVQTVAPVTPAQAPSAVTPRPETSPDVHLVDLARALADSLDVSLDPAARGRPWSAALADPAPDGTLPRPGPLRTALAALVALAGLLALRQQPKPVHAHPRRDLALAAGLGLLWPLLGWLALAWTHGAPTLSNPVVFPPQGKGMLDAAIPAIAVLLVLVALADRRGWSAARIAVAALVPWLAVTIAAAVLARVPDWLLHGPPPLTPRVSAAVSVLLTQGRLACLALALALSLSLIVRTLRRRADAGDLTLPPPPR